jgi:hypothetical protein
VTQKDIDTLRDTIAGFGERLVAVEARGAEIAGKVDNLFKVLGPVFDRFAIVDTQQLMIDARAPQRQANPTKSGSATPYDAQVDRIGAKRRELIGAKK